MNQIPNRILRLRKRGASIRQISRELKVSRYSVGKVIYPNGRAPRQNGSRTNRESILDAYDATIRELLANSFAISVKKVFEELKTLGFCGGYSIVRERVRRIANAEKTLDEEKLKLWLFDILMSKRMDPATTKEIRNIANLDRILDRAENGSIRERKQALAVLALSRGVSIRNTARYLQMSRHSVSDACRAINRDDENGPIAKPKRRRKHGDVRSMGKALIEILHHKPIAYGVNRSSWTYQSVADVYEKEHGKRISSSSVRESLKEAGYAWKKSRRVLTSPDPDYREKVELLLQTLQSLTPNEMLFFVDELGPLQVKKHGGRRHSAKKETPTHPQKQLSKGTITMYGALSATTNQVTWLYGDAKDTAAMIDLIEFLFNQYYDKSRIFVTWDAASWHRSNQLVEWVNALNAGSIAAKDGPVLELVPLPHCAQFLNVIEAVFSGMKRAVIHNSDYNSEKEMKTAISRHFQERNDFFTENPKRVGKRIWEIDFFDDYDNLRSGMYREY